MFLFYNSIVITKLSLAMSKNTPTKKQIEKVFYYQDGELIWKDLLYKKSLAAGSVRKSDGAVCVRTTIGGLDRTWQVAKLIFTMHKGYYPKKVRHLNGDLTDNRIENLVESSNSYSQLTGRGGRRNNSTGVPNVTRVIYRSGKVKYLVQLRYKNKRLPTKVFESLEEAGAYAKETKEKIMRKALAER